MKKTEITNYQDVIDSRDIIARIEELEEERQGLLDQIEDLEGEDLTGEEQESLEEAKSSLTEFDESEEGQELKTLQNLAEQGEGSADWQYGETLIRESYFTDYCEELVGDIGDLPREIPSYIVIDWDATAENIKADYSEIDFDGVSYYIRA